MGYMKTLEDLKQDISRALDRAESRDGKTGQTDEYKASHLFRDNTRETYEPYMRQYADFVYKEYGVTDVHFLKPEMADRFLGQIFARAYIGDIAPSTARVVVNAVGKMQDIFRNQVPGRIRIINVERQLERMDTLGLERSATNVSEAKANMITPEQADQMINAFRSGVSASPHADTIANVLEFQKGTGSRISASLKAQVKNVDFEKGMVTFVKDKQGKTRTVEIDREYLPRLRQLCEGKAPGRRIFEFRSSGRYDAMGGKQKGEFLSTKEARRLIERNANSVAKRLGMEGANTHSMRKVYAQRLYDRYRQMSKTQLEKRVADWVKRDRTGRTKKALEKHFGRKLTREEMAALLVSMALGHSRLDVLIWYIVRLTNGDFDVIDDD